MAKRKYTRIGEKSVASQCSNKKCNWQGTDEQKIQCKEDEFFTVLKCPKCGNSEFYGLLELPKHLNLNTMKNLITITLLFISALLSAQVSPVFGVKYTGGLSYNLDHEYPSVELGFYKNLSDRDYKLISGYYATVEFLYDNTALYSKQETGTKRDLEAHNAKFATILKVTNLTQIQGNLSLTTTLGVGFTNEKSPAPITNLGIGLMTNCLPINAGISFENLAGQNHLSITAYFHLDKIFNKKKRWEEY